MVKTKDRGTNNNLSPFPYNVMRWKLGEYIRLSKEDAQKAKRGDDSNSVVNQCRLLDEYHQKNIDEFDSVKQYIDDGCTGTDTNREHFQRLLTDIHAKRINCVIVKDLSRLARNYTDAGSLIDNLFVTMNVRFISLQENIDNYKDPDSVSNMIVPITNVFNENFCAVTSKKIRQVFDYKKRNGEFIAPFAPHGYIKDPNDKHALLVDPEAAEVIKQIFSMFLGGMSKSAITIYLNDHGIPCPSVYKRNKGVNYQCNVSDNTIWYAKSISDILSNRIYTGDLVQGRRRMKSYKIHTLEDVPQEDWIIVENTHEAIIDKATFAKVQGLLKRDTRTAPKKKELYLFSGFLKCADCGKAVTRHMTRGIAYYHCSTYKVSRQICTMHTIKHNRLEAAVLYAIQQQVYLAVSYSDTVSRSNTLPVKKSQSARLDSLIAEKEKELAKIKRYKQGIYEDWKDGEITHNDYRHMREDYDKQAAALQAILDTLTAERAEVENGVDAENLFLATFRKYENIDKLTREILIELVDHIKIYEGGDISVRFKFADEYRRVAEYIKANTQKAAV